MDANRIFICHTIYRGNQRDAQILNYLIHAFQGAGIEVIINSSNSMEGDFFQFLQQNLPTCKAFILFQTPETLQSPQADFAVKLAQTLVEQKRMQEIFRFISTSNNSDIVPITWKALTTFDGTRDYKRAVEKLLLATSGHLLGEKPIQPAIPVAPIAPPPARTSFPKVAPKTDYDRPLPPSRFKNLKEQFQNQTGDANSRRKLLMLILIVLIIITIIGSAVGFLLLNHRQPATAVSGMQQAYFFSSNQGGTDNTTTGMCDEVQINLQNITVPAAGNNYYAWLLPDLSNAEGTTIALGKLAIKNGATSFTYTDPKHENLLLTESRFLITEESANSNPIVPSPNHQSWRYYSIIPQTPNSKDPNHFSDLDHIRHLLGQDPLLQQLSMQGGLNTWFYQNIQQIFQLANVAQDELQNPADPTDNDVFHDNITHILEYLDGANDIQGDVPAGTILTPDTKNWRIPLLTSPMNQNPPAYIYHIETHMQGITGSPGATSAQQTLAGKIDAALNNVNAFLEKVRQDAKQLVLVPDDQAATLATTVTMNDLMNNATNAFIGQLDTYTGTRQGGATWIHDIMPQLAMFDIQPYTSTSH